jgi:acyl dehydratase
MNREAAMSTCWPNGKPQVGATAELTRTVDARDIELFTEISGDRNPLHYDADAAAATRFGGIVVQGGITSAILNAVVAERLPGPGSVFLNTRFDFKAPVRPGDEITGRVVINDVRSDKPVTNLTVSVTRQGWNSCVVRDGGLLHDAVAERALNVTCLP